MITAEDLAAMERKSLAAIQERGGAQVGDKTMVDALAPAVDALEANSGKGDNIVGSARRRVRTQNRIRIKYRV